MIFISLFLLIPLLSIFITPFLKGKRQGIFVLSVVIVNAILSSYFGIQTLMGQTYEVILPGSAITGPIPIRLDALGGWFLLISNLVFTTGGLYGLSYLKAYREEKNKLTLHGIAFLLTHTTFLCLFVIQNGLVFLIVWEVMALSAFILVIFESEKASVIKAGINFLIQSHISILFLMLGFMWVSIKTGSYDFMAIKQFSETNMEASSLLLFLFFFVGFAIKSGFVPFHTWLPYAHPAAPAHISGIMSGVLIKIGIFGILRIIFLMQIDYSSIGYGILTISVISSLYGVMLAIVQHNIKKLLAYHSIENIGIIGIGIGIGCIGLGSGNHVLSALGFAGALLHTLNHALFKSLLFYTAGIVYQASHILDIEKLGGLIKKMPKTALLFLIASIAICGIPPFNGFISEFLIYSGLFQWLHSSMLTSLVIGVFSILALAMVGGLAILCFTKAFSVIFLGTPRHQLHNEIKEAPSIQLLPLYIIAFFIVFIGLAPHLFFTALKGPVSLITGDTSFTTIASFSNTTDILKNLGWVLSAFVLITTLLFLARTWIVRGRKVSIDQTWGCGYAVPTPKIQYTASSFVRTYTKLFGGIIMLFRKEKPVQSIFPDEGFYKTSTYDKVEYWMIDKPIIAIKSFLGRFLFLQNGRLQYYIIYGIVFIVSIIAIPLMFEKIIEFIEFLKQL